MLSYMHLYNIHFICEESHFTKIATLINFHNAISFIYRKNILNKLH